MSGGSSQPTVGTASDVEAVRDACVSKHTRVKYKSSLNGIKRWIVEDLSKYDSLVWFNTLTIYKRIYQLTTLYFQRK
ncbi:hypothetical protein F441_01864 [Phytophthora nicotianae CJ01A1]|uniref:Uncharacterized protein n=4 Tax=Phytophthora nicotianae TaxID=4792 RepID=W2QRS8_PHYN3|nr:hypothetical protein PPTG_21998 [Phytophthora nicotianae INRA-310]ETI55422.1 hypothetical protein F443_01904 [Phytophthora nicotianae P1569]ETN15798.1 hypothetical protein PPTG_21998 [Phytophthora nicotianae INRA-310]ETO84155.1 hypothetical protein F444_01908 [Phytophthora nicotianae P1976]ETP25237.1 hypothetical protein F441_01864 [Phytophthora nicotianae CJ01A1]